LIAQLVLAKYGDHAPLYRLEVIVTRLALRLDRGAADLALPIPVFA
jgi:transposase